MREDGSEAFDILGIGMSVLDTVHLVPDFPSQTGVTEILRTKQAGGGPVPTALCAAARHGAKVAIFDRIGDDWKGDRIVEDYRLHGVETLFIERAPKTESALATVLVREQDGERHILFEGGGAPELTFSDLPDNELGRCRMLHLNGRHWPACLEAAERVRRTGGKVSFDGGANRYDPTFEPLIEITDVLIVARNFAEACTGESDPDRILKALGKRGAEIAGFTDGDRGSWFRTREGECFHESALPLDAVVDTTGCGDVFHGAFLSAHVRGADWKECARFATAAAALNAGSLGGRGCLGTREEIEGLVRA